MTYKPPSCVHLSSRIMTQIDDTSRDGLLDSLATIATQYELAYLLSHHDDGVIWGRFDQGGWVFSSEKFAISPEFNSLTLQECRLFGETAELFLWRNHENTIQASLLVEDESGIEMPFFEQQQLLWGDNSERQEAGFTLLREGSQGLRHAVPLTVTLNPEQPPQQRIALTVRHYIAYDNHQAYVKWSRLTDIKQVVVGQIGRTQ